MRHENVGTYRERALEALSGEILGPDERAAVGVAKLAADAELGGNCLGHSLASSPRSSQSLFGRSKTMRPSGQT